MMASIKNWWARWTQRCEPPGRVSQWATNLICERFGVWRFDIVPTLAGWRLIGSKASGESVDIGYAIDVLRLCDEIHAEREEAYIRNLEARHNERTDPRPGR